MMKRFFRFLGGVFIGVGLCVLSLFFFKPDSFAATTNSPLVSVKDTQQKSVVARTNSPQPQCGIPDYGPCQVESGFMLRGSYLYWHASEDGLDFAQTVAVSGTFPERIFADVVLAEPNFQWSSGFQAGIGYTFPQRQQWDVFLNWTRYHTHAQNSMAVDLSMVSDQMLRPSWCPTILGAMASSASTRWKLYFNTLDLSIGREFLVGQWFSVHPKAGARGAWVHQKYRANYDAANFVDGSTTIFPLGPTSFDGKWQYNAGGLRVGSDFAWHVHRYFSIVGNLYGSALYGKFKLKETFIGALTIDIGDEIIVLGETLNFKKGYFRVRPALETEMGLQWHYFFGGNRVALGAYYGFSYWFDQNPLFNPIVQIDAAAGNTVLTNTFGQGDLQLQGLRVELEFDF